MRRAALLLLLIAACGGGNQGEGSGEPADDKQPAAAERPDPEGKKWGGWRWKGKRDDCFFVVKNKCFDKQADACAAAGCDEEDCLLTGGGPAKVSCKR